MNNQEPAQWMHSYIETMFDNYDYRSPKEPWNLHGENHEGIRNCAWQMKAFHYWWIINQCYNTGDIGLAINLHNHPFCLNIHTEKNEGHLWSHYNSIHKVVNEGTFPLVIASAVIPAVECILKKDKRCTGTEVIPNLLNWIKLLKPGGVLIAGLLDERGAIKEGRSLTENQQYNHAWTPMQFERTIIEGTLRQDKTLEVEEFDTFKNGVAFNVVLRKK